VVVEYLASAPHFFDSLLHSKVLDPLEKPLVSAFSSLHEAPPEPLDPTPPRLGSERPRRSH
jgi:hypothetical protein